MIRPAIRETTSVQKWHPSPKATSATPKVISRVGTLESSNEITPLLPRPSRSPALQRFRHRLWWDSLDLLYFAGQAGWNYLCVPFIFDDPSYELEVDGTWRDGSETWRRLKVTFPSHIHTHCRQQIFYADRDGLIRRMDYTAGPFGERAKAAHYEYDHRQFSGFVVPTRRRVHPRKPDGRPRRHPVLVSIDVANVVPIWTADVPSS